MEMPEGYKEWRKVAEIHLSRREGSYFLAGLSLHAADLMKEMAEVLEFYSHEIEMDLGEKATNVLTKFKEWK